LKTKPIDTEAVYYARRILADWREAGIGADMIEHFSPDCGIDGYALRASHPDSILSCVCRCWSAGSRFRQAPAVWTIEVLVSRSARAEDEVLAKEAPRRVGYAVAATHEEAWRQVRDWQRGELQLQANVGPVAAEALSPPKRAVPVRARWSAVALIGVLAALGAFTYGSRHVANMIAAFGEPASSAGEEPAADPLPARPQAARSAGDVVIDHTMTAKLGHRTVAPTMPFVETVALVGPALSAGTSTDADSPPEITPPAARVKRALPVAANPDELSASPGSPEPRLASPDLPFALQVASVRGTAAIPGTWDRLQAKFPAELAGLDLYLPPADGRSSRSRFYRVVAGAFASRSEAQAACDRLRAAGGDCLVIKAPEQPS
jgi:hypothetical protein